MSDAPAGFVSLFDGKTLAGWHTTPRVYGSMYPGGPLLTEVVPSLGGEFEANSYKHPAQWSVEDGVIVGRQDPRMPGYGGYLVTDQVYGDFELQFEVNLDWPADSGVMLRKRDDRWEGFQVLIDLRKSGTIGQFYGNGLGAFHAVSYNLDVERDADGAPIRLIADDPATTIEAVTDEKRGMLEEGISAEDFIAAWKFNGWNHFRVVCAGESPQITVWVNGVQTGRLDAGRKLNADHDLRAVTEVLGVAGHIALDVHDNDPIMGAARWAPDSACRWRNIFVKELGGTPVADQIRAAFIGAGFMGQVHTKAARTVGARLAGIVGLTPEETEQAVARLGVEQGYASLDAILTDPDIDVVHILTPNFLHAEQALAVIRAGKHVTCEKPQATDSDAARRLVAAADEAGVVGRRSATTRSTSATRPSCVTTPGATVTPRACAGAPPRT